MTVGAALDTESDGPICSELWPGNTTDVQTLLPVVDRLRSRFALEALCIVADRGMISTETVAELLGRGPEVPLHPRRQCDQNRAA